MLRQFKALPPTGEHANHHVFSVACDLAKKIEAQLDLPHISCNEKLRSDLLSAEAYYLSVGYHLSKRIGRSCCPKYMKVLTIYFSLVAFDHIINHHYRGSKAFESESMQYRARNPYIYTMH